MTIRIGDDAAETHAFYRARNLVKSDGTGWDHAVLMEEIARQLADAADRVCPECVRPCDPPIDRKRHVVRW